jgi:hypothetical protein
MQTSFPQRAFHGMRSSHDKAAIHANVPQGAPSTLPSMGIVAEAI